MKTRIMKATIIIIVLILNFGCNKKTVPGHEVGFTQLTEKSVEIVKKKILEECYIVSDPFNSEIYTALVLKRKNTFKVRIYDAETWELTKEIELKAGDFRSPTEYCDPVYIERIGDRYYVVDQFEKIVVYDLDFNHRYSSIHHQPHVFIDIFKFDRKEMFTLATKQSLSTVNSIVKLFRLTPDKRPELIDDLSDTFKTHSVHIKEKGNQLFVGQFWASTSGYEHDGKIYYASGYKPELYIYDIAAQKTNTVNLSYLKAKKYTGDEANTLGYYNTDGWEKAHFEKFGGKVYYFPYPDPVYHLGIFKIGKNKMGIAADIDLKNMTFRLDVIDTAKWVYLYSIRIPAGFGFRRTLTTWHRGFYKGFINIDTGLYVERDEIKTGEEYTTVTRLTRFKVK